MSERYTETAIHFDAEHLPALQGALEPPLVDDVEVVPDRAPEAFEIGHRPAVQIFIMRELKVARSLEPFEIQADLRDGSRDGRAVAGSGK